MIAKDLLLKDALKDRYRSIRSCDNCHYCKWVPLPHVKSYRFAKICPSVDYYSFHSHSLNGKLAIALARIQDRIECSDRFLEVVYQCMMDGGCDIPCKMCRHGMEPIEDLLALRAGLVAEGYLLPQHIPIIESLRNEDNMMMKPKAERGKWAEGLDVKDLTKESAKVLFHAGCRLSFDDELQKVARTAVTLLKNAGVDVGIMGKDETCCGTKAYEMGYQGEFTKYAESTTEAWSTVGVKTVVTACSECYHGFVHLYPKAGLKVNVEVLHITQYLDRLIKEGKLKLTKEVPIKVTYHDPCHLGRRGEPYIPWTGTMKKIRNQIPVHVPPKPIYRGVNGVYEPPRDVLKSIPGLELVEMERIREYSWCCGAGGGVKDAYPDFSLWTAAERIEEAKAFSAEAIATACPWCERNFIDAIKQNGTEMKVYDIVELVQQAI